MADDKEVEKTIAEDLVVTKYKLAGQIVNSKLFVQWFLSDIIGISLGTTELEGYKPTRVMSSPCGQCA